MNTNRTLLIASGVATLAALSLGFGTSAFAGGEPIEPIIPELPELPALADTPITLPDDLVVPLPGPDPTLPDDLVPIPMPDDPEITIPDDIVPVPLPDDPDPTVPDDLVPVPVPDPTDPTDPVDPVDPGDAQDPTPTPQGSLPQTGATTMLVAGLALAATAGGAFLCVAAGRRSRSHS